MTMKIDQFDGWLEDGSEVAALFTKQMLQSVEGKGAVVFPPSYLMEDGGSGYNIDHFDDGTNVCLMDSVGSQANRMEPIFKKKKYEHLVPKVTIKSDDGCEDLLDIGHRAADARVQFSTIGQSVYDAFIAIRDEGNAEHLARIAPTTLVFGAWDSRATHTKLQRMVRSVLRAHNVKEIRNSAVYFNDVGESFGEEGKPSEIGLDNALDILSVGGVMLSGSVCRDMTLNLTVLRSLNSSDPESTLALRRYLLALSLVCFTAPLEFSLREGCQLVIDAENPPVWKLVKYDGDNKECVINHADALEFATMAAKDFGVNQDAIVAEFNKELAHKMLKLSSKDRKLLKGKAISEESISDFLKSKKSKK